MDVIRRILQSVCFNCKRIKVNWTEWVDESGNHWKPDTKLKKKAFTNNQNTSKEIKTEEKTEQEDPSIPETKRIKVPVAIRSISPKLNTTTDDGKTLTALAKYLRTLEKCAWCGTECDKPKKSGNSFILKKSSSVLSGEAIFNVFKDITHEDCMFMRLGNNVRPEWFLFYRIVVVNNSSFPIIPKQF